MRQDWNDDRIDALDRKVDGGFRQVDARFDQIKGELGEVKGELKAFRGDVDSRLEAMHRTMLQFCVGAVAVLAGMAFTLAGIVLTQI